MNQETHERIPYFEYDAERKVGRTKSDFRWATGIRGYDASIEYCALDRDGVVTTRTGYEWDFATGAIDTISMVVPSLVHDVICQLTNEGHIAWSARRKGDVVFRKTMKQFGVSFFRRWWCYIAVRINSTISRVTK